MPEIHFILVEPAVPENIGAAARALKTMGFSNLILVDPKGFPDKKAEIVAHGANDILKNARIVQSLEEATGNIDFLIGTTAKSRAVHHDYYEADEIAGILNDKADSIRSAGLVFGREESGLTNAELALCHLVSYIPAKVAFPSLNLAQAVMVYAYLLSQKEKANASPPDTEENPAFTTLYQKAAGLLQNIGFEPGSNIYNRFLERIAAAGCDDIHLMLSLINRLNERI